MTTWAEDPEGDARFMATMERIDLLLAKPPDRKVITIKSRPDRKVKVKSRPRRGRHAKKRDRLRMRTYVVLLVLVVAVMVAVW